MSSEYPLIEQDPSAPNGQDGLPTYDDLAAQNGPNSRFGRWRGWIEKRAAERYLDISPEERARRRERGWGNGEMGEEASQIDPPITDPASPPSLSSLHIQTGNLHSIPPTIQPNITSLPLPPLPFISKRLSPTHLKLNQFGSRFLPHTTSPIRCLLPIDSDRLLLIGTDEGLSVLDMFPQEWSEDGGLTFKGPNEAQARVIWQGESVAQMSLLEVENSSEGMYQGVVLALVSPEVESAGSKDGESIRSLRMYNLASLVSLAKWTIAQNGSRPLDLHRPSNWQAQQSPVKKARPQSSIARSLKSLLDPPGGTHSHEPSSSAPPHDALLSPSQSPSKRNNLATGRLTPNRKSSDESSWEVIEDLPLRWATDFVPLATSGSRLTNLSVLSYALWQDVKRTGKGGQLLAIATKNSILLYETPKGERAFRFVKEFYTPLQPRIITFFKQSVHDVSHSSLDAKYFQTHRRTDSASTLRVVSDSSRASASSSATVNYGTHLTIFVVFEKKAGWIRVADSAVGELELQDVIGGGHQYRASEVPSTSSARRSRVSLDISHQPSKWVGLVRCTLPIPNTAGATKDVNLITRGIATHILPCPLPIGSSACPPLFVMTWRSPPTSVSARICQPSNNDGDVPPFLQVVALGGEYGVEVQEVTLSFLGKGKGRAHKREEPLYAEEDLGGDSGFLCTGGHWDQSHHTFHRQGLNRSFSALSAMSANSYASMESEDLLDKMKKEQGIYGWCRKGLEDWRVFWLGGSLTEDTDDEDDPDR